MYGADGYICGEPWESCAPAGWSVSIELATGQVVPRNHPMLARFIVAATEPAADAEGTQLQLFTGMSPIRIEVPDGQHVWTRGELTSPALRVTAEVPE